MMRHTVGRSISLHAIKQMQINSRSHLLPAPLQRQAAHQRRHERASEQRAFAAAPEAPVYGRETWLGTQFDVYKGKAAVQFKPIVASFKESAPGTHVMDRQGVLLLDFANAVGSRTYDWQNKISFALSVTEMADIFMVPGALGNKGVQLFHDPGMQSSSQGEVTKSLQAKLMPDGSNVNLAITETQSKQSRSVSVPLSPAEVAVVTEMVRFLIPRCLGLDKN